MHFVLLLTILVTLCLFYTGFNFMGTDLLFITGSKLSGFLFYGVAGPASLIFVYFSMRKTTENDAIIKIVLRAPAM